MSLKNEKSCPSNHTNRNVEREAMKLRDFKYYFKKHQIQVQNVIVVGTDFRLIEFKIPKGLEWYAGQHGLFSFGVRLQGEKNEYPYSISSIMDEGVLRIAVKLYPPLNQFKNRLLALKQGDTMVLRGPIGPFRVQDTYSPIVLIAGGIGITPIRAVLKYVVTHHEDQPVHVIYASEQEYIYEEELKALVDGYDKATIDFVRGIEASKELTINYAKQYNSKAYYYISGSKTMILAYKQLLIQQGVDKQRIIHDPFYRF
jgi:ferredoxin-NADP reductase